MRRLSLTLTKLGIGAALTTGVALWRRHQREVSERAHTDRFAEMLATIKDEELAAFHANLQTLATFDADQQFARKRDACRTEMERRAQADNREVAKSG
jgi:hypothetical protein